MRLNKYSGAGNTFVLLENEELSQQQIQELCSLYYTDGLIILKRFLNLQIFMHYFNADGLEANMCGNGLRCVIQYLWDQGIRKELYTIGTRTGVQKGFVSEKGVTCFLQPPHSIAWDQKITFDQKQYSMDCLNSGVPHAVLFMNPGSDLFLLGQKIRYHDHFHPEGTNVNFVTDVLGNEITIRTYERGVERETLACGTGAIASALAVAKKYNLTSPIRVKVRSNEILTVTFSLKAGLFADITLTGSATSVILERKEV